MTWKTENMEKAEKLRPAQSFPSLCHSPRNNPVHRAVLLGKAVSVSELIARYQSILDCERNMTKQEHPKLMERRYPSQTNATPMGKNYALSPSHPSNMCPNKSMEGLPIPNISAPTRNLKGLLTSSDTPKVTPRCKSLHCAPLKTPPPKGLLRKREADASPMTTIQPLSMEPRPRKDPSFLSSLQNFQRKAEQSPATIKWKESSAKEGKLLRDRPTILSSVPGTASDSTMGRSYDRTRSFLDTSDNTIHILQQGRGRSSAPSVKELSALYLSQTAAADAGSPAQPTTVKDNSIHSPRRQEKSKPMLKEMCASCLKPIYSMERVAIDRVCVHRSCFCCQVCRRKLSLQNYAALHGVFYCQVHYKQMAGAGSRSEMEKLEHQQGDHQVQRGPQPQDWCNRTKKTETREKLTSSNAQGDLQLAEHRQELNSRSVLLGNKIRTVWPPSGTALLAVDGKAGKEACSWKKSALSLQTHQAAGSRAGRMVPWGQEGKSAAEAAVEKGRFLPGITYAKEGEQVCSWPKNREQRGSEKAGVGNVPEGKRGSKVSQRVAAIQQGQAQLKRGPASPSFPPVLEPVKPLPRGSLVLHTTHQSTKPTKWADLQDTEGRTLPVSEVPEMENKVCGSLSTPSEGGTTPDMTNNKPELTVATTGTAGDKDHLGERMNSTQHIHVPEEPEIRDTTSTELKCVPGGVDLPENEAQEAHSHSDVLNEKLKVNTKEFLGKQIAVTLGESMQPSSISDLPGIESKGRAFEKTKEEKAVSISGSLKEVGSEHPSQQNKAEKRRDSSSGLPEKTDDHGVSCLQETELQDTCGPLKTNTHKDNLRQNIKSPGKDFPGSTDTPPKGTCAAHSSHDEVINSKSKDSREVLNENILNVSEQPAKTSEYSRPNISLDKSRGHPVSEEEVDLKLPEESTVPLSQTSAQSKETRSSQACRETSGKGFRFGRNPFITLFGSEDKGNTPKKETTTQRKPMKPQSALVTLFGYSSEKKQSPQEKPAGPSEQANTDNRPEKPQGPLSSSSQAKQKAYKNDQLPQPGKMELFPKRIQESSGSFSNSTDILLLAPGTSVSHDDKHERTDPDIHDQMSLNSQVWQQQDCCCPPLMPAQENQKEAAEISESGTNLHPPPEVMPAADNGKNLTREGNHRDAHPLETQNLLSLDLQDTVIEDGILFSPDNSEKLPKEAELHFGNMDFLEDNSLFFSGGQDFPSIASKIPNSALQNSEAENQPFFDTSTSELFQEIPAETSAPLELWDTSSLSLLDGQDEINIRDLEGIQSCAILQQLDLQCQAPKAAEELFGLGLSAEDLTNKHLSAQEDNFPFTYLFTSHVSETFNQGVFDQGQESPEKMRKTSGIEEDYESLPSEDLDALNDDLSEKHFFI
ncbi:uncharacterized protein [Pithys albifrons albifrons]|uniref:uncharacterized protein isoform X2 n=1 Tax=Pithys albifrons albifrons TaxID=3385563 RepID=UPI003A5CAF36